MQARAAQASTPSIATTSSAEYSPPAAPGAASAPLPYGAPPPYTAAASAVEALRPLAFYDRRAVTRQSRGTVLVRYLLAIPHTFVLGLVTVAEFFVFIIAWLAALFTGQVPDSLYRFIAWVTDYGHRVGGYLYLLTDKWPAFSGQAPSPTVLRVPGPTRLNRLAVFFRGVLAIPAWFMTAVTALGVAVLIVPFWLIVLIKGRVPEGMFDSLARVLRYQVRFRSWLYLLTPTYPSGLLKDEPASELPPPAGGFAPEPPRAGSGRRLMVTYIVLGVLTFGGSIASGVVAGVHGESVVNANNKMVDASHAMEGQVSAAIEQVHACRTNSDPLGCAKGAASGAVSALQTYKGVLDGIDFQGEDPSGVATVKSDTDKLLTDWQTMATAPDATSFQQVLQGPLFPDLGTYDDDLIVLNNALGNAVGQHPNG